MNYITMLRKSAFLENVNKLWGNESMNKTEIYKGLRNKFGDECQIIVAIEELAELQKELTKLLRCNSNLEAIAEEMADVEIMLEQLKMMFNNQKAVAAIKNKKLHRTVDLIINSPSERFIKKMIDGIENLDINKI